MPPLNLKKKRNDGSNGRLRFGKQGFSAYDGKGIEGGLRAFSVANLDG